METITQNPIISAILCGAVIIIALLALVDTISKQKKGENKTGLIVLLSVVLIIFAAILVPVILRLLNG
jgi:FtsH-binding integral membrane protein